MGGPAHSVRIARVILHLSRVVIALISVAALAATAYAWVKERDVNAGTITTDVIAPEVAAAANGPNAKPLDGAVDILLVGVDSRTDAYGNPLPDDELAMLHAGEDDGERNTDTMILVHIPAGGQRAVAISFPRDSWVDIAGESGKHRINSAFAYGYNAEVSRLTRQGVKDEKQIDDAAKVAGRKNLIATIENLIGRKGMIDRYAEVNLAGFYDITNAVGGVEVCLNQPAKEWRSGIDLPAGRQTISGVQALAFVRQRHNLLGGDLDRIVRQQVFIGALANKVLSAGTLTNMDKLNALVAAIKKSVVLSDGWDITTFAQQMSGLSTGQIDFRTIPTQGGANIGGADVLRIDPDEVRDFVSGLVSDEDQPTPSKQSPTSDPPSSPPAASDAGKVTVQVRNGSDVKGLASSTLNTLTGMGFRAGQIGDATEQATSVISYAPGDEASATLVANALGAPLFDLRTDRTLTPGHVRVTLGLDYPQGLNRSPAGGDPGADTGTEANTTAGAAPPSSTPPVPPGGLKVSTGGVPCVN